MLSALAGAAQELDAGVIINPYDVEAFAAALARAIDMTADEQMMRMRAMRKIVAGRNVFNWASEILEGLESSNAYSTLSLDAGEGSDDGPGSMLDSIGVDDVNLENVEVRESLKPLLDGLHPREKRILLLRFFKNMTQSQIAERIGVSQMHVSRLLTRTLAQLRRSLEESS